MRSTETDLQPATWAPRSAPSTTPSPPSASAPRVSVRLRLETVTIDRSGGFGAMLETVEAPVLELHFIYAGQRVSACDPRDRVFCATASGVRAVDRDVEAETRVRALLESFGAVDLECLDTHGVAPGSHAHYLLRYDGDVHDYVSFAATVLPKLAALGIEVAVDRDYPYQAVGVEQLGYYADLEADEGRPDWFSLELGVDLGGQRVNLLPALIGLLDRSEGTSLSRLRTSERRIALPLPDGRYLALPPEEVQGMLRVLSELYEGRALGEDLRLTFPECRAGALPRLEDALGGGGGRVRWGGKGRPREVGAARVACPPPPVQNPNGLRATLRDYQRAGLEWMQHLWANEVGGILADDMGLGKTLQCIAHLTIEKEAGRLDRPALVVAPTSLIGVWAREIARFSPGLRVLTLSGPRRHERFGEIEAHDVVLTSYPLVTRDEERLAEHEFHALLLDEAHIIKNRRSQAHRAVKRLSARHRLCITGTPVENNLGELHALFDFLEPGLLGDELSFRRWYRGPIEQQGDEERLETLRQKVGPFILRRLKREVAKELPDKTELLRPVTLEGAQRDLYERIRVAAHGEVRKLISKKGLSGSTVPILEALTKLRQVCCDPRLVPMQAAREVRGSAKYDALFELLDSARAGGHRTLVFSQFTRMLALIARGLDERTIPYLMLTGESRHRQRLVDAFEGGQGDVFLISLKAGGVGLTLTSADTVIHYDPWWNPSAQDQATDRAYRIGQTKNVHAYNLFVAGSVEERMLRLQAQKRRLAEGILSGASAGLTFDERELEALFAPLDG